MDHPYYTTTVTSLTRGWSYSVTEGIKPDLDDRVVLVDPLTYTWKFRNGIVPGQIDPFAAAFNVAARTADDVPELQIGDLVTIDVRVGTTGPRVIAPPPMRIAAVDVELILHRYGARAAVSLTDLSVDWTSIEPGATYMAALTGGAGAARLYWRARMAEIANRIGYSIGCPTWWADDESPDDGNATILDVLYLINGTFSGKASDNLEQLINSHQPDGFTHTWVTIYAPSGHPTGYRRIGPDDWDPVNHFETSLPEPDTGVRIEAVPASRRLPGSAGLPLTLAVVGGLVTIVPVAPASGNASTQIGVDADWCTLPATVRRSREGSINLVNVKGKTLISDGSTTSLGEYTITALDVDNVNARGVSARDIETQLVTPSPTSTTFDRPEAGIVGGYFLGDTAALTAEWAFDSFELHSDLMPQDMAEMLLPIIAPRTPGETDGDGQVLRHVTIFDIDTDLRFQGRAVRGFITGGTLTIAGGRLNWSLDTIPGGPQWTDAAPDPITFGDLATAFPTETFEDVDPHLSFADLAYVGAP